MSSSQATVGSSSAFLQLSEGFGSSTVRDFHPLMANLRAKAPVMQGDVMADMGVPSKLRVGNPNRPVFSFFSYQEILQALKDPATYSSAIMLEAYGEVLGRPITG